MATPNYDINYNDKRFTEVENDKKEALSELEQTYGGMISESDSHYNQQIEASKQWAETQKNLQQEQTDFAIDKIEQQKAQAKKDYTKEQSGAYVDWQKQSNQYGANAEQMAASGMTNTGYSESSQVSMYNTYQNRITAARESYNLAVLNYDNAIKEAQLQNNSVLAEIAYQALQTQLELSLAGFQYKNQLITEKVGKKFEIDKEYNTRYQQVLSQINHENTLKEQIRQHEASMAFQREQFEWQKEQAKKTVVNTGGGGTVKKSYNSKGSGDKKNGATGSIAKDASKSVSKNKLLSQVGSNARSYDKAIEFMKNNGISNGGQRLLTSSEWNKAKRTGELGSELEYSSYTDYVANYLTWRIQSM